MSQDLVPVMQASRRDDWLVNQLPMGMVDDDFFVRFVRIFQAVATTIVEGVDNLEHIIDVTVAPAPVVRWLGTWLGVDDVDSALPHELQRRIVLQSSRVLAWRGTRRGLVDLLELISGAEVEVTDSGGVYVEGAAPYALPLVRIRVASTGWVPQGDFAALVRRELPANVHCEIHVGDHLIWPVRVAPPPPAPAPEVPDA